jgi:beta-phosphoglucomutase-like phosphatase (HAD superfamily)
MLAVFDNDGTICDSQEVEGRCYDRAIATITGRSLTTLDWSTYEEPTSSAIIRGLLKGDPDVDAKEEAIKNEFLRLLKEERPKFPGDFSAVAGARPFIEHLKAATICSVAIATGCFDTTAAFKLECCGLALANFPHATASDTSRRRDIISLAVHRAGFQISDVVYFGDAPWDVSVSRTLGIPMIGIGRRVDQLRSRGLRNVFRDYSNPDSIIRVLNELKRKPPS